MLSTTLLEISAESPAAAAMAAFLKPAGALAALAPQEMLNCSPLDEPTSLVLASCPALKAEIWAWSRARGLFAGIALDGAGLSIDNGANRSAYGRDVTPRMVFEGRAPAAPSAAITRFRDALEEAGADTRAARTKPAPPPAADPGAAQVQPLETGNPATTTPLPDGQR